MNRGEGNRITTILLVENSAPLALRQRERLERAGFVVVTTNTDDAVIPFREERRDIDIVLMDIDPVPGVDGMEAARRILHLREIPIIFLSSRPQSARVRSAEDVIHYGYILKDADDFTTIQTIETALHLHKAHNTVTHSELRFRSLFENAPHVSVRGYGRDGDRPVLESSGGSHFRILSGGGDRFKYHSTPRPG